MIKQFKLSILAVAVSTALLGTANASDVVKIGETNYLTFKAALDDSKKDDEITLYVDLDNQNGYSLGNSKSDKESKSDANNITINLNNHKYVVTGNGAGSEGTETQAFQLLKQAGDITIKNGIIVADNPENIKMVIQNYSNLTLENVTLDGRKLSPGNYTLSNNCGTININNSTIYASENGVAFDAYYWPKNGYTEGVEVKSTNSTIYGKIEVTSDGTSNIGKKHNLNITGGVLASNSTNGQGGKIYTVGYTSLKNVELNGNTATEGGAIYNNSGEDRKFAGSLTLEGTTFKDNTATEDGGAIYNKEGSISIVGDVVFENNKVNESLNDIFNTGSINVEGTLTLDGGITGGDGTITFESGSKLVINAGVTTIANNVTNEGAKLALVFKPGYQATDKAYQLVTGTFTGEDFDIVDNALFDIKQAVEGKPGSYTITKKTTDQIMESTGATGNQARALSALISAETNNEILNAVSTAVQTNSPGAMDAVTAMSPEAAPMVAQVQTDTAAQVFGVIGSRLGGSQGMASGDGTSGTALWVQGMVGTTDMDDTSKARGYSADSNGLALGLEAKPTDSTTIGMGFAYTNTDVDGFLRSTDVDSYTAFLYGEYKPANWYVNGILSYAWANYEEQANVAGYGVDAKYDADTLGLQLMGGLDLAVSGFTVTPEAGLRYYHISTDSYTNGMGTSVADSDEDVLTGVIGARFAKTFEVSPAMSVVPQVRLAMTYDIVDADNTSFVTLANGSSYSVDGETLDRFGVEADIGVKAEMGDNFEMSLSYEGAWRGDYQNHAGILNAKYKF